MRRNLMLIWGWWQCCRVAADWHDGQFAHGTHAPAANAGASGPSQMFFKQGPRKKIAFPVLKLI
jgi:hypothetical protein